MPSTKIFPVRLRDEDLEQLQMVAKRFGVDSVADAIRLSSRFLNMLDDVEVLELAKRFGCDDSGLVVLSGKKEVEV